jgi:hypothetical protein
MQGFDEQKFVIFTTKNRTYIALQNIELFWVICALPDPDQAIQNNSDPCGSGSKTLVLYLTCTF